jgi:drug/metabolite transporter (DMT)-like permease
MAHLFFGEYLNLKKVMGIAIGFAGFIFMLAQDAPGELTFFQSSCISAGEAALLIAAVTSVYGWSVMRSIVRDYRVGSIEANGIAMIVGGILILAASLVLEGPLVAFTTSWMSMAPFLVLSVVASNILGYGLYGFLLNTYSTTLLSFAGLLEPPIAALYGYIFLAEPVGLHFFIAMTFVLAGLFIFYRQELSQGYVVHIE